MLSRGARYSGLYLGMSCPFPPHGVKVSGKKQKEQSEDRANLHHVKSLRVAWDFFRYMIVKL